MEDFDIELRRVVDRLRSMPVRHLPAAASLAYGACGELLALAAVDRKLPRLADHAAGDQLAVIAADLRREQGPDAAVLAAGADILTRLRRALP